jgi:hypothetical protein
LGEEIVPVQFMLHICNGPEHPKQAPVPMLPDKKQCHQDTKSPGQPITAIIPGQPITAIIPSIILLGIILFPTMLPKNGSKL